MRYGFFKIFFKIVGGHGDAERELYDFVEKRSEFPFFSIEAEPWFQASDDDIVIDGKDEDAVFQIEYIFYQLQKLYGDDRVESVQIINEKDDTVFFPFGLSRSIKAALDDFAQGYVQVVDAGNGPRLVGGYFPQ